MARKFEYSLVEVDGKDVVNLLQDPVVQTRLDEGARIINIVMLSNGAEPDYDSYNDEGFDRYEVSVKYAVLMEREL